MDRHQQFLALMPILVYTFFWKEQTMMEDDFKIQKLRADFGSEICLLEELLVVIEQVESNQRSLNDDVGKSLQSSLTEAKKVILKTLRLTKSLEDDSEERK